MHIDKSRPILIVDDCAVMSNALRGMLQKMGFRADQIDLADSAKIALTLCAAKNYQLLLLDFNLASHGMNGYQLLTTLREEQSLAADCVTAVVTADASLEVVRSFMELEPDGYLVKPISYQVLSQRLQELLQLKQRLCPLLLQRREQNLPTLLSRGGQLARGQGVTSLKARLLMAEACIEAADYDQARELLSGLKSTSLRNRARLLLARAELLQEHLQSVFTLVRPLQDDPLLCSEALTLKAEACVQLQQLDLALDSIRQAIALCPRGTKRYWLQAFIEMAGFDLVSAQETVQRGLRYARHMQQDEIPLQQLLAALQLDVAEFATPEARQEHLTRYRSLSKGWQGQRLLPMAQSIDALLRARADILCGTKPSVDDLIELHRQQSGATQEYQMGLVEEMEWNKLIALPEQPERLPEYYAAIKSSLPRNRRQTFRTTMSAYMEKWRSSVTSDRAYAL